MNPIQIITLILLGVYYIAYFTKAIILQRRGITIVLLGKGDKPKKALMIELFLRVTTLVGAIIQFLSVLFPNAVWSLPTIFLINITGLILMLLGNLIFIVAMKTMRNNWRAGFDRNQKTSLVTNGIYKFSRNPAFVGFDLLYLGCAAIFPNVINITAALVCVVLFHIQILGEEKLCTETFGQEYADYKAKVMRYLGRSGRISANLKVRAKQLKIDIPAVFLALKRKEIPLIAKILAVIAVGYALSPIDLIPDFIPVIGFLDDVILLPGLIALVIKFIPTDVFTECREQAAGLWKDGKPKKWYYALPIILIWCLLLFIVKVIWL